MQLNRDIYLAFIIFALSFNICNYEEEFFV